MGFAVAHFSAQDGSGAIEQRTTDIDIIAGAMMEQLWFTGAAGEYNPNDEANLEVEP